MERGQQLGFGKDGSVEIERFRIFNPPVLVPDPNGEVVRESVDESTGKPKHRKYREDPVAALRKDLAHTISIVGKDGRSVVKGKVGNTTSTFRPAAGANTPVDGVITNAGSVYSTVRDASSGTSVQQTDTDRNVIIHGLEFNDLHHKQGFFGFDMSAIGSDEISSATFSLAATGAALQNGDFGHDRYRLGYSSIDKYVGNGRLRPSRYHSLFQLGAVELGEYRRDV